MSRAYRVPKDPGVALDLAARIAPSAFLAGGTSNAVRRAPADQTWIDLSAAGLDAVRVRGDGIELGAMATLNALLAPEVGALADGVLRQAVEASGPEAWRNHATLGGRLLDPDVDDALAAALLVQDATAFWQTPDGATARFALGERPRTQPALLLRVELPARPRWRFALESLRLTRFDTPVAAVAVGIESQDGRVTGARVAASGLGIRQQRAAGAESALDGAAWPSGDYDCALEAFAGDIEPRDDIRASAAFRGHVAAVLLGRALADIALRSAAGVSHAD